MKYGKYAKDGREVTVSEKAYKLLYKEQGYLPVGDAGEGEEPQKEGAGTGEDNKPDIEKMSASDLKALAKKQGIEGAASLNKEELLAVLKDVMAGE